LITLLCMSNQQRHQQFQKLKDNFDSKNSSIIELPRMAPGRSEAMIL